MKPSPLKEERNCMKLIKNESIPYFDYNNYNLSTQQLIKIPSFILPEPPITYDNCSLFKEEEEMKYVIFPSKNYCSLHNPMKKASSLGIEIIHPENILKENKNQYFQSPNNIQYVNDKKINVSQKNSFPFSAHKKWNITTFDYDFCFQFKKKKDKISKKLRKVIEKVNEWIRLSSKSGGQKYTKEEAAVKLGIKKKSLDDYLMYLRLGIVLCYDFEENIENKFGQLKRFIIEFRTNQKWNKQRHKDVDSLEIYTKN